MFQQVERHRPADPRPVPAQAVAHAIHPTLGNALGMPAFRLRAQPEDCRPRGNVPGRSRRRGQESGSGRRLFQDDVEATGKQAPGDSAMDARPLSSDDRTRRRSKRRRRNAQALDEWIKDAGPDQRGQHRAARQVPIANDPELKPLNDMAALRAGRNEFAQREVCSSRSTRDSCPASGSPIHATQPFDPFWFPPNRRATGSTSRTISSGCRRTSSRRLTTGWTTPTRRTDTTAR